jgi:glyoxylase-like metal-dependent hydrolase (beta-lactamase superfamily II)
VRVRALSEDILVATSAVWGTTSTVVRSGDECFVVDSPVLPEELEVLPALLAQAGFTLSGLLATHGDWDHLLARMAFPSAALGVAETTATRLTGAPGAAQRELRDFDQQWYVSRPAPLALGSVQALPVPGKLDIGERELELHSADGHTVDGMAIWVPWAKVLIAGDYLSPVEIPMVVDRAGYRATLERLRPLVEQAEWVVPGHGDVLDGTRALAILREDVQYLEDFTLPIARRDAVQRGIDAENRGRLS